MVYPGMLLQKITTKEPDESQIEVGIASIKAALGLDGTEKKEYLLSELQSEEVRTSGVGS